MKLYNIGGLKSAFTNQNPDIAANKFTRFFSDRSLFDDYGINTFYIHPKKEKISCINEDDFQKLCLLAKLNIGGKYDISGIKFYEHSENWKDYTVNSRDEYKAIMIEHYKSPEIIEKIRLRKEEENKKKIHNQEFSKNVSNYDIDITNKKIVSIDFEFNPNKLSYSQFDMKSCSECGISVLENNEIKNYHYIIEDGSHKNGLAKKLVDKFEFGESQYISSKDLINKIKSILQDTNYVICHGMETEFKILTQNGIEIKENNIEMLDTLRMFSKMDSEQVLGSYRLKDIVRACDMETPNLHNAGNDSAYTLITFMIMNSNPDKVIKNIKTLSETYKEKNVRINKMNI